MKRKRNIKSIVLLAALGIATLFFINISFASTNAKVNVETANLRESADENSKILEQLSQGQEVEIVEKSSDWYKVKVKGMTGYLRQDLLTVEEKNTVNANTTTSSEEKAEVETTKNEETKTTDTDEKSKIIVEDTKLKIVPSINATDIIEVKKDEEVIITETINDWVCVQTKTTKGWIYKEKLKSKEDKKEEKQTTEQNQVVEESKLKTLYIGSESVNLRKEANTNSEVVTKLSLNTAVDVYAEENGWSKVKVGDKTYLFHNTDKWHTFKKNGLTCLYNYKRFIIRFDFNKVIGFRSNLSDLPQSGREMWTAISDHSGSAANEVILRSYNDEELYARKNVQIFLQDHKIKQMLIYWDETEAFKGFTKEEKIFLKGCFEKMGISSKDAQEWLNTFMIKKTPQSGKLGSWTYSKGNSKNQVISLINHNENNNYVNFYKKSKGNN